MERNSVAVVGAAETTKMGKIPDMSVIGLHADAALNALADAGLKPSDIDGVATAGESPVAIAQYLGITPTWVDRPDHPRRIWSVPHRRRRLGPRPA
jgi:acetyl-CoA acetyltransferase